MLRPTELGQCSPLQTLSIHPQHGLALDQTQGSQSSVGFRASVRKQLPTAHSRLPEFEDSRSPGICAHSEVTSKVRAATDTHALYPRAASVVLGPRPLGKWKSQAGGRVGGGEVC